jgi:hypothetical protein
VVPANAAGIMWSDPSLAACNRLEALLLGHYGSKSLTNAEVSRTLGLMSWLIHVLHQ